MQIPYVLNGGYAYFEIAKQITKHGSFQQFSWMESYGWKTSPRFRYNMLCVFGLKEFPEGCINTIVMVLILWLGTKNLQSKKYADAINKLKGINDRRPNSFLVRTFFDAKSDEIQAIFSGGPQVDITKLVENLNRLAPTKQSNWSEIKF